MIKFSNLIKMHDGILYTNIVANQWVSSSRGFHLGLKGTVQITEY